MHKRRIKTGNRQQRINQNINSKVRNKSGANKNKPNSHARINSDIEGLNIQTDNFFTNIDQNIDSWEAISPLIGSVENSMEKKIVSSSFKSLKKISLWEGSFPRKSAMKNINFSEQDISPINDVLNLKISEEYDEIRQKRQILLRTAKAWIYRKVNLYYHIIL